MALPLILGEVGLNFAAGMTGGVAYVYDEYGTLESRCNMGSVQSFEVPTEAEIELIHSLIEKEACRLYAEPPWHQDAVSLRSYEAAAS